MWWSRANGLIQALYLWKNSHWLSQRQYFLYFSLFLFKQVAQLHIPNLPPHSCDEPDLEQTVTPRQFPKKPSPQPGEQLHGSTVLAVFPPHGTCKAADLWVQLLKHCLEKTHVWDWLSPENIRNMGNLSDVVHECTHSNTVCTILPQNRVTDYYTLMLHMIWFSNIQYPVRFSETEISQPGFVNILSPNFQWGKKENSSFFFFPFKLKPHFEK